MPATLYIEVTAYYRLLFYLRMCVSLAYTQLHGIRTHTHTHTHTIESPVDRPTTEMQLYTRRARYLREELWTGNSAADLSRWLRTGTCASTAAATPAPRVNAHHVGVHMRRGGGHLLYLHRARRTYNKRGYFIRNYGRVRVELLQGIRRSYRSRPLRNSRFWKTVFPQLYMAGHRVYYIQQQLWTRNS